jgi:hypothetical protein
MKIEIDHTLYHSDWCDFCPLAHIGDDAYPWHCGAGFWKNNWENDQGMSKFFHFRPQECKDKFGI